MNTFRIPTAAAALTLAFAAVASAQPLWPSWLDQFGTPADDWANAVAPDGSGGVFVTGYTAGDLSGPNAGLYTDAFVAHYDSAGIQIWVSQFGSGDTDEATALAADGSGGLFVTGYTYGDMGGPNAGLNDAFIARLDASGDVLWVKQYGSDLEEAATGIALDGNGGVFVGGRTGEEQDIADAFLARFDSDGEKKWWLQFGFPETNEEVGGLASDGTGGVLVGGSTDGDLGGPCAGETDPYIARYDSKGQRLWITQFGSAGTDFAYSFTSDGAGGSFIGGFTSGNFGGPNAGSIDGWVARCDPAGHPIWVSQFGTSDPDFVRAVATDGDGGAFAWGSIQQQLPGYEDYDFFLARLDGDGGRSWTRQFGSAGHWEIAGGVTGDGAGGAFVCGVTDGDLEGKNLGQTDAFIARFTLCAVDCDGSDSLGLFDFLCFINQFNAGDPKADCDGNTALDLFDFLCFTDAFNAGC